MAFTDPTDGSRTLLTGTGPCKITLAGVCKIGDPLGYSSGWYRADANASIYAELVAGEDGAAAQVITAYTSARIGGISSATAGGAVYLSDTAGGYSESAGTVAQIVGVQESTTVMVIKPGYFALPNMMGVSTATKIGFWGTSPAVRPAVYTQTYSSASSTANALTSATLADSSTGTASTATVAAMTGGAASDSTACVNNIATLTAMVNKLTADMLNVKQVQAKIIDNAQIVGLAG